MYTFVLVIHVIVSILLMIVILLQDGKGGDVVSALGGGSQTVFGSTGATTFLTKATIFLTVVFAVTSLSLAVLKTRERKSILQSITPKTAVEKTEQVQEPKKGSLAKEGDTEKQSEGKAVVNGEKTKAEQANGEKETTKKAKPVETKQENTKK